MDIFDILKLIKLTLTTESAVGHSGDDG